MSINLRFLTYNMTDFPLLIGDLFVPLHACKLIQYKYAKKKRRNAL